jgi:hypothetical protein
MTDLQIRNTRFYDDGQIVGFLIQLMELVRTEQRTEFAKDTYITGEDSNEFHLDAFIRQNIGPAIISF